MGHWAIAFLLAIGLHLRGSIVLDLPLNLLLAAVLAWPWPPVWRRRVHRAAVLPALALLYHQSNGPPPERLWALMVAAGGFDLRYLASLVLRSVDLGLLAAGVGLTLLLVAVSRRLRLATWVFGGLIGVALMPPSPGRVPTPGGPGLASDARRIDVGTAATATPGAAIALPALQTAEQAARALQAFHDNGREMRLRLPRGDPPPPFDLLILNICSLGWDDLALAGLQNAPLLKRFDLVFDRFNSGATYSAPAVLRLLQSTCGAAPESALYGGVPSECLLWHNLELAGYEPALLLNHDGRYGQFGEVLRRDGGIRSAVEQVPDAPVTLTAFDGSPIHDDGEVLTRWWRTRTTRVGPARLALLYNTITLHDGNREPGGPALPDLDTWAPRARTLMAELMQFADRVEASGRPTVIVMVSEHGAALRGDARQIAGLRELPTPSVTHVPAGVMVLGFGNRRAGSRAPIHVPQVTGHLGLMTAVAALMHGGPEAASTERLTELVQALPTADWVAENGRSVYLQRGPQAWVRDPDGSWAAVTQP